VLSETHRVLHVVMPGGSGRVGRMLARHFHANCHSVVVFARRPLRAPWRVITWDGVNPGSWIKELDGADVLINLVGRDVNCRYNAKNRQEIMESRVHSTHLLGEALNEVPHPPRLWMNASTATIYRHALDRSMDEYTGEIGGNEPNVPSAWRFSIQVATQWEKAFFAARTTNTRKIALRSAVTMSPDPGGIFDVLLRLVRFGIGGASGSGKQHVSWIHEQDFVRAIDHLIVNDQMADCINLAAPNPLSNTEFMHALRNAYGQKIGLRATEWMLELGAIFLRTETELILKSRRVVPVKLLESGFQFMFPDWPAAAQDLVNRWRQINQ
jgi:uncharacterized protein (TIGR01777 family)